MKMTAMATTTILRSWGVSNGTNETQRKKWVLKMKVILFYTLSLWPHDALIEPYIMYIVL